ncbi:ribosome small subunit-dependent GTPase A [Flagellimonas sp. 389]|uniref:ribosome small subunit-dependent GTPase A n=1 Tax=Flagellimonas sp. 389 TaxID=2835862 RepID=UPI001BD38CC8|nr:ribosome small subunit-dependent GTPase A [Flagellimonas sp. 389]MBS9463963.1 ribosome small subunit-dependent GTPase A [Flagellimonas sp. 389]
MKLEDFGYNKEIEKLRVDTNLKDFEVGRIIVQHKEKYIVKTERGDFDAEITGNLRYSANGPEDFPAVGDWVALVIYDAYISIIHKIIPRVSVISRQAIGKHGDIQVIAANVDFAFIVQAIDRDFSINRIERYLTICNSSEIKPIIILNKIDLIADIELQQLVTTVQKRIKHIPLVCLSNTSKKGLKKLEAYLFKGKTYCFLGSSGVGKSSLINNLIGNNVMATREINERIHRGKHTTTHRELLVTEKGIFIDNPGMREIGITSSTDGITDSYNEIFSLAKQCKFSNCKHIDEIGCAVLKALNSDKLNLSSYQNYLKMEKEKEHFELTVSEKRKKDKKFGKMIKNIKKRNKY